MRPFFQLLLYASAWSLAIALSSAECGALDSELLRYLLVLPIGVQCLCAFMTTQKEHMQLAFGLLGILCFWFSELWLATALGSSIYHLSNAYTRLQGLFETTAIGSAMTKQRAFSSAGAVEITLSIAIPLTLWLTLLFNGSVV